MYFFLSNIISFHKGLRSVSGVYDERGSYQKVVNVEIQSDFESIQNVFVVIDHNYVNN